MMSHRTFSSHQGYRVNWETGKIYGCVPNLLSRLGDYATAGQKLISNWHQLSRQAYWFSPNRPRSICWTRRSRDRTAFPSGPNASLLRRSE